MSRLLQIRFGWRGALLFPDEYFEQASLLEGGYQPGIKVWNGSTFEEGLVRVWTGSVWRSCPVYYWDGTAWKYMGEPGGGGPPARFGNETLPGGSTTNLPGSDGRIYLTKFTSPASAGTLDYISVYSPVSGVGMVKGVLYADNGGVPGALLAVGAPVNTATIGWHISTCAGEAIAASTPYWLGSIHLDFQSASFCSASNGVDGWAQFGDSNYASPENPLLSGFAIDYDVAVFCEYTT